MADCEGDTADGSEAEELDSVHCICSAVSHRTQGGNVTVKQREARLAADRLRKKHRRAEEALAQCA